MYIYMENTNQKALRESTESVGLTETQTKYVGCEAKAFFQGFEVVETKNTEEACECGSTEYTESGMVAEKICSNCGTRRNN